MRDMKEYVECDTNGIDYEMYKDISENRYFLVMRERQIWFLNDNLLDLKMISL